MGGGGHKSHESFVVAPAPAAPTMPEGLEPLSAEALDDVAAPAGPASAAQQGFDEALANAGSAIAGDGEVGEQYEALKAAAAEASTHLDAAAAEGVPAQLLAENQKQLKKLTKAYLAGLDAQQLQALAVVQGFEHPTLVGLNTSEGGPQPLVHWLDPSYGPGTPSKLAIQAKASERFAELAAGGTIGGLTLADVQAAEAGMPVPAPAGGWQASPADIVKASAAVHQALAEFEPHKVGPLAGDGGLGALVAAENHLATAQSPQLGADLEVAKASAKASVDKALQGLVGSHRAWAVHQVMATAQAEGTVSEVEAKWLSPTDQLALLRESTSPEERAGLKERAATRAGDLATLAELKAAHGAHGGPGGLAGIDTSEPKLALEGFAASAGAYFAKANEAAKWSSQVSAHPEATALTGSVWGNQAQQSQLTTDFRTWAKTQKLSDLRDVAASMGMDSAGASRAHVQNFIAASWDPAHDKASIAAAAAVAANKAASPKAIIPKPAAGAPAPIAPAATTSAAATPAGPASAKSFSTKHLQIVEALKAHQAVTADLPPRPPAEEVSGWSFGPATAANLGGGHTKSLHAAPDGSMWMFKPDKTGGGARAHAEAKASEIFSRVGVPSVAVYARKIDGTVGSVQPLVKGATTLSADTTSWSQADVDNLVRYHVAAWAVGDHDGNPANVIRTPSGGLCPVDQGQAFKFYGRDKLSTDYHPNDSYGSVPVFHQAYAAAKAGNLAKGVAIRPEAALPTIKAFEAMPDSQYRAILALVASEGAKHGVHWVEPMRKAAQKRLGKPHVSNDEVAEEFLRTAVERKHGLRSAFASFFTSNGFGAGAKLEKVA